MKGIILTNANYDTPSTLYQSSRLMDEFQKLGVDVTVLKNDGTFCNLNNTFDLDFCIFLDKDTLTAEFLERRGVRVFNSATSISICDDKVKTYLSLFDTGVVIPKTIGGVYRYVKCEASDNLLDYYERELSYPMVVKLNSSSLGEGVFLARDREQLKSILYNISDKPHHVQEFIGRGGEDYRLILVGGKVVATMKRSSDTDFRSNVELGGVATKVVLDAKYITLAERVAQKLSLDYCGIDIISNNDMPVLLEVNSNAYFGGIESVTGVNVARSYANHVLKVLKR